MSQDQKPIDDKKLVAATDADLLQENAMLHKTVEKMEAQLKLAVDALSKVNDKQKAQAAADKADIITRLVADSKGKFTEQELANLDIRELKSMRIMADALGTSRDEMFASVAALTASDSKKLMGIDYFDPKTQQWRVK